jgi:hypothetical protein
MASIFCEISFWALQQNFDDPGVDQRHQNPVRWQKRRRAQSLAAFRKKPQTSVTLR